MPTAAPMGRIPLLPQPLLDRALDGVVELEAPAGEELDPVVRHRVVRGRDDDAEIRLDGADEVRDGGRRYHPGVEHVDACAREPRGDGGGEELSGDPGVAPENGRGPVSRELSAFR